MRAALYIAVVITVATASPSGYYHQDYNYKTSSSSYRNNELQHKTDDQGYYSKDGDLEGRVKPKVSSNSEHSEYINPKVRENVNAGYYDAGADMMSQGNMLANSYGGSVGGSVATGYHSGSQYEDGVASSDYIRGAGYSGSSYSSGSGSAYESANLQTIGSRLQNDLQHELQSALISEAHHANIAELEADLRRNLSARLNQVLLERFGTQTIRGGQSYSLNAGRLQARPNYDQHELDQLQRQMESSLLNELRQEYNYRTSHSSHQNYEHYESTTTYRPSTYRPVYPSLNVIDSQDKYPTYGVTKNSHQSQYNRVTSNTEYSQIPNAVSITTIASNVQRDLNNQLNRLLEQAQRQYFSENSRQTAFNTAPILDQLRQELRQNLTYTLEEELRRHFGNQFQRSGYMFSVGSGGESNQYNYKITDLENLKKQVEENLITKLNRDFETARQHWISTQQHSQSQQTHYGQGQIATNDYNYPASNNLRYEYSTPRYSEDNYYRPTAASIVPLISSGVKTNQYHGGSGAQYSGYDTSSSSSDFAQLERQLQADLSSQLQGAISQNRAYLSSYSSMGGHGSSYDDAYRRLYEELQRNLTQQLQSFEAGSSAYSHSYGGVSESQLAQLRSQLQRNLASQLQQGLQQSYSASASYSASSGSSASAGSNAYSSSNAGGYYRGTRGSDNYQYGQYRAGGGYAMEGEDCQGDDSSAHQHHRARRSYGGYSGYRSRPLGLSTHAGSGYNSRGTYGGYSGYGGYAPVGQEEDDSETIQPGQGDFVSANQGSQNVGQEIDDTDDTQQIEVDVGFTAGLPASGNQIYVGQEEDDSDDTQQIELKPAFSAVDSSQTASGGPKPKPSLPGNDRYITSNGRYNIQSTQTNQKPLYQATNFGVQGNLPSTQRGDITQSSSYNNKYPVGQEEDDSDDMQQIEDNDFTSIGLGSQIKPKPTVTQTNQKPLYQASNFEVQGNLQSTPKSYIAQSSSNNNQYPVGQQSTDTKQIENNDFIGIGVGSQIKPKPTVTEFSQSGSPAERNIQTGFQTSYNVNQMNHRQFSSGYQGSYKPSHGQIGYSEQTLNHGSDGLLGQEEDDTDDTQQLEVDDDFNSNLNNENRPVNNFNIGKPLNQHTESNRPSNGVVIQASTPKIPSQNSFGVDIDDINMFPKLPKINTYPNKIETSSKPSLHNSAFLTPSTPRTPKLNFATQNILPEPESVEPLPNSWNRPGSSTSARPFPQKSTTGRPSIQIDDYVPRPNEPTNTNIQSLGPAVNHPALIPNEPTNTNIQNIKPAINQNAPTSVPQFNIPDQLKDIYFQLQANLSTQIEEIVKNELPIANYQNQLYKDSLYTLRESIKQQCQKLLEGGSYSYLNIQQQDVTVLQKYAEIYLIETLNEQFKSSGYIREPISYQPVPQQPSNSFNIYSIPYSLQPNIQQLNIPAELKDVSNQLEIKLTRQIEEIINNELPYSASQNQLYKDTLYTLRENITREYQELLKDRRYSSLNIRQIDLTVLEKYIEANLIQKLNDKFKSSGSVRETIVYQVVPQQPFQPFNYNGQYPGYRQKPQVSSSTFLQREINFQGNQYPSITNPTQPNPNEFAPVQFGEEPKPLRVNPINSVSFVNPNLFPQTSPQYGLVDVSSTSSSPVSQIQDSPQPGANQIPSSFQTNTYDVSKAEQEADLLIQTLRNKLQNRQNTSSITQHYQPKYKVIQVTLENITSEQLQLIRQIEKDFSEVIAPAVQNKYASSNLGHGSKYELYQASLRDLEQELKRNLSATFNGRISEDFENANLKKYFTIVNQKFRNEQIADVQKYLEIRLTKNIRVQLKSVYDIETTAEEDAYKIESNLNTEGYISQKPIRNQARVVRLENLTPTQVQIIEQIEQDINDQIEKAIQLRISSLKTSNASPTYYQQALVALESELKNNITESLQQLCEPGLNQNSDLILKNFDQSKIHDVEKYLEIKLINKLTEKIIYYSSSESTANSRVSHHSSSSIHSSHGYNSYHSFNHNLGYSDETLDGGSEIQEENSHLQHAAIPSTPLQQGSVKGGGTYSNHKKLETPDIESQHADPDAEILSKTSGEITSDPENGEPTTKAPWWKRFGNKVKKIVGKA